MSLQLLNRFAGALLVALTATVTVPLSVLTVVTHGGTWGFGIVGLGVLLPLCTYGIFGIAGLHYREDRQRRLFLWGHAVSGVTGMACLLIFPVYPSYIAVIPLILAFLGVTGRRRTTFYLLIMILLGLVANALLLKWETEFGRTLPLIQLLTNSSHPVEF